MGGEQGGWRLCKEAMCKPGSCVRWESPPGGEQVGPREAGVWEVSSYKPGNLGLVTEHTQRPGCQEAEGFFRVSVKPRKVLWA